MAKSRRRTTSGAMPVTAFYASLLAFLYLLLSVRVIFGRSRMKVGFGDGGDPDLLRRVRVHANCAEYAPFALLLIGLAETLGTARPFLHAFGLVLLVGRILHAAGVSRSPEMPGLRVAGMAPTFAAITGAALACLASAAPRVF